MLQMIKKRATALMLLALMLVTTVAASLSVYASDGKDATEKSETIESDASGLDKSDFVSNRLVVMAEEKSDIAIESNIIGEYGDVYLLQYGSAEETMKAYEYLKDRVIAVEPDIAVSVASKTASESGIQVDEERNPVDALNDIDVSENPKNQHGVIALIDTGVSESDNVIDRVSVIDNVLDGNGHGDEMAEAIISQDKDANILSIRAMDNSGRGTISSLVAAIEYAIRQDVDYINLSLYAKASLATSVVEKQIMKATSEGITVVGAAGNDGEDAKNYIPGSVEAAYVIGASDADGKRLESSNYGTTVDYNVVAGSTSEAAAKFTGFLSANGTEAVEKVLNSGMIYTTDFELSDEKDVEDESEEPLVFTGTSQEDINGEQTLNIKVIGNGSVTLQDHLGKQTDITGNMSRILPRMTYARFSFSDIGYLFVEDGDGVSLEPFTKQKTGSFRDVSIVPGLDKTVVIVFDDAKAMERIQSDQSITIAKNLPSDVTVDEKYTGSCKVTSVDQSHAGGTVHGLTFKGTTGYLNGISVNGNCADRTAAAPFVGQACSYEMTVKKISGTSVTVYVYVTPKKDATDGITSNENGLIGYQRMEGTITLKRDEPKVYTDLTVKKTWSDCNNSYGLRPSSIRINLYRDTKNPVTVSDSTKYDSVTLNKSNGWKYTWKDVLRTGDDGKIYYYSVREANVPDYYKSSGGSFSGNNKDGYTATFKNTLITDLTVNKEWTDNDNEFGVRPSSIKVELYRDTKNPVNMSSSTKYKSVTLNASNKWSYTWKGLTRDAGNGKTYYYKVREVEVPDHYSASGGSFSGNNKDGYVATIENSLEYGYLKLQKLSTNVGVTSGNSSYSLKGAEYTVYSDEKCTDPVATLTTSDASGNTEAVKLLPDTYYVKETKASPGYLLDTNVYKVAVKVGATEDLAVVLKVKEEPRTAKIEVEKSSSNPECTDGNRLYTLAGAEYSVYKDENCTQIVDKIVTDENGHGELDELAIGKYWVKETKAPDGYTIDPEVYEVDATSGDSAVIEVTVKSQDTPIFDPAAILLKKVDKETGNGPQNNGTLSGAQFEVKYYDVISDTDPAKNGEKPLRTWVFETNENGFLRYNSSFFVSGDELYTDLAGVANLPYGTFTFKEIKAPEGYLVNDKIIVQRTDGYSTGSIVYQTPTQEEDDLEVRITKIDSTTGKPVSGVVFEHTMPDGAKAEYTTDKNGLIDISCLGYGTHKLIEKSAPDGFEVNTAEVEFKVAEDNSITVVKGDAEETDTNGKVTVDVAEDGCIEVQMENKPSPYKILVHKTNEKDTVLPGAEFTLYSDAGCKQEVAKGKTDGEGELYFENLIVGKIYYLKETEAPAGYQIPVNKDGADIVYKLQTDSKVVDGEFAFIVNDKSYTSDRGMYCVTNTEDGRVCEMTVLNYTGGRLPETGSSSMLILIGAGIIFVSVAGVIFLKRKKDNN